MGDRKLPTDVPRCALVRSLPRRNLLGHPGDMATLPKAPCPSCSVPHALLPTKRIGYGSVKDHKIEPRALVLCPGSMVHVAYAEARAWQLEFERLQQEAAEPAAVEEMLFEG